MALINTLNDIGNAIREKTGGTELIPFKEMASAIQGISSGGGAELNIAYGDTEPDDTSKLWIKANEPESIVIGKDKGGGVESIETLSVTMPEATYYMASAIVGNKVYLFGGYSYLDKIRVFDIETQTITTLSNVTLSSGTYAMGCASVGTKIYLFGGFDVDKRIEVFDTETQTITKLSVKLPSTNDAYMACASVGTKIYGFGGNDRGTEVFIFDTETENITTQVTSWNNQHNLNRAGCVSFGTKIYLFGTSKYDGNYINVFDTETKTMTTLSVTLPTKCYAMGCARIKNKIYLFGGYGDTPLNTINVFDIETETITTLSITLPKETYGMGCISNGNEIYLFGGYETKQINKFTNSKELTQNNIEVITADKNFFNIVNTDTMKVEIGVDSVLIGNAENQAENCEAYLYQNESWVQI